MLNIARHFSIKKIKYSFISFILISLLSLVLKMNVVNAQSQLGLQVSPPSFELSGNPGDYQENTIKITNLTDQAVTVVTEKRNFTAVGEEGAIELTDEDTSYSLASWMEIEPNAAILDVGETKLFTLKVDLPANAEPGGHFGSAVFRIGGDSKPSTSGASVAQEVASLVLMRIAGDVDEIGEIASFSTSSNFYEYGPVEFDTRISNSGSVHLRPSGTVTITNMFGKQVDSIEFEGRNVLPGATRKITNTWDTKYLFGRYTATAVLNYGTEGSTLVATTTFMGMPYKIVTVGLLGFVIFLAVLIKGKKRFGKAFKVLFSG